MLRFRLAFLAVPLFALGCEQDPVEPPPWAPTDPNEPGTVDTGPEPALGGQVALSPILAFDGRFGLAEDINEPCVIDTTEGFVEQRCRLEANELDLFFHGWGYNALVDAGTCTYLGVRNYVYMAWEIGNGPTEVSYTIDSDSGLCLPGVNETAALDCVPTCAFDYSQQNNLFPNCCYGEFNLTVNYTDGTPAATTGPYYWGGGPIGECFGGAAFASNVTALDANGFPFRLIFDIDEGANTATEVLFFGPIEEPFASNVTVANYVNPNDPTPLAFSTAYQSPLTGRVYSPNPFYIVDCLDDAEEVLGRITVEVEEWDTVAEFVQGEGSNPDIGQRPGIGEPQPLEENGLSPINDFYDWRDFNIDQIDWVRFRQ